MKTKLGVVGCLVNRIVRHFGYALIPVWEIERMERDAESSYKSMKADFEERGKGYFNGIGDHASKTALRLRERYMAHPMMNCQKCGELRGHGHICMPNIK